MFLAPSSSRAVDPYLQTLLLRVSLSRLGGKHRQLAAPGRGLREFIDEFDGHVRFQHHDASQRRHLHLWLWVCAANGSGGFNRHLTNSPTPKSSTSEDSNKLARSHVRGVTLLPDLAKETEPKLEDNSSSTQTQIDLKPKSTQIGTLLVQPVFVCAIHHLFTNI